MRTSAAIIVALAGTTAAQSATALTFWNPGPANNPSQASKFGLTIAKISPVASIITSDAATTVFAVGCPTSAPRISTGSSYETCPWATNLATYTIISSTRHILHETGTQPEYSAWWSCDYNAVATQMTCDMEIAGSVNDNTDGPISGLVFPDQFGYVVAFATAEVVATGRFGELDCGIGYQSSSARACNSDGTGGKGTMSWGVGTDAVSSGLMTETGSAPTATASRGGGSGGSLTATSTVSGSAATASAGAAGGFGVDAVKLGALVGGAAFAAW